MAEEEKPKKARKPAARKAPQTVDALVQHALKLAALKPGAKWSGATVAALFPNKEPNVEAAVARCVDANRPLLKQVGTGGLLTGAGFAEVASTLAEDEVAPLAKSVAAGLPSGERAEFLQAVIGRTPLAAAELIPLLEEANATAKAELEAQIAAAAKHRAAEEANRKALERALQLIEERRQARIQALLRLLDIEGQKAPDVAPRPVAPEPERLKIAPVAPDAAEDRSFRRDVAAQLASAWRATWEMNKPDAREFLESAMWNISGFKLLGEPGQKTAYSGRVHESVAGVFSGDPVTVVRPGWALDEDAGEFVVLKAVVEK